jgi:uncharacterized protein YgbK (DUF1537 family)
VITVVLDDDPTGAQAVADTLVVLDWSDRRVWDGVRAGERAVHMLTNSRAHTGAEAAGLVASAAAAARGRHPSGRLVLRGDSTLRAHVWEEYAALRAIVAPDRAAVPLLLVPALPAAGRVTIAGVHLIERDGMRVPLDRTEYARDGALRYSTAVLADWADERSGGRLAAADAVTLPLERLRGRTGANDVARALAAVASLGRPAVVVPDAETDADLATIARGLRAAEEARIAVVVRCAPAFAAILTGTAARSAAAPPAGDRGVLLICGSFVSGATAQLERLARDHPRTAVPARAAALAGPDRAAEVDRVASAAAARIEEVGLAVVATERARDPALVDAASQRRVAMALAEVARAVPAGVVVAKGGITSAVTVREGLGARAARVIGPILPGVALWRLPEGTDYVVVPGNVGGPELLADVIAAIGPRAPARMGAG